MNSRVAWLGGKIFPSIYLSKANFIHGEGGKLGLARIFKFAVDGQRPLETNPPQGGKYTVEINHSGPTGDDIELNRAVAVDRNLAQQDIFYRDNTQILLDHSGSNRKLFAFQ